MVTGTLSIKIDMGWRIALLNRLVYLVVFLPQSIQDRLIDWSVRGVKIEPLFIEI